MKMKNKKDYKKGLKNKMVNCLMISGHKRTSEALILSSAKNYQKKFNVSYKESLHCLIRNSSSSFKIDTAVKKRGKKKDSIETLSFLSSNTLRITKFLKIFIERVQLSRRAQPFYLVLSEQIRQEDSLSDFRKVLHENIKANHRYSSNFRW